MGVGEKYVKEMNKRRSQAQARKKSNEYSNEYVLLENENLIRKTKKRKKAPSIWPRLSSITPKIKKKHLFPRPKNLGPYKKHLIDEGKCPMTEALSKKAYKSHQLKLENLFFKTSGLNDSHRVKSVKSSFLETNEFESVESQGIRVHTGEIIFLSKSEITSEI